MWVVIDTETTGLDPYLHSIIEIGLVITDDKFNQVGHYTSFIKAHGLIEPEALKINNIDLKLCYKDRFEVAEEIKTFLSRHNNGKYGVIAHNWEFDKPFIHQIGVPWGCILDRRVLDTKVIAQFLGYSNTGLSNLLRSINSSETIHRALDDAKDTLIVLKHFMNNFICAPKPLGP